MKSKKLNAKVLIADDDIPTTKLFRFYLKNSGFNCEVIPAHNGVEAIEQCWSHLPEIIFMDINMPYKDGITAIEEIRAGGFTNPIVVITAYPESEERCLKAGANAVVSKPVSRENFLKQFKKFCKNVKGKSENPVDGLELASEI